MPKLGRRLAWQAQLGGAVPCPAVRKLSEILTPQQVVPIGVGRLTRGQGCHEPADRAPSRPGRLAKARISVPCGWVPDRRPLARPNVSSPADSRI